MKEINSKKRSISFNSFEKSLFSGILNTLVTAQKVPVWLFYLVIFAHFLILIPSFYSLSLLSNKDINIPVIIKKFIIISTTIIDASFLLISLIIILLTKPKFLSIPKLLYPLHKYQAY